MLSWQYRQGFVRKKCVLKDDPLAIPEGFSNQTATKPLLFCSIVDNWEQLGTIGDSCGQLRTVEDSWGQLGLLGALCGQLFACKAFAILHCCLLTINFFIMKNFKINAYGNV